MENNKYIPEGYKDLALGIILQEWEVKRLGDIANKIDDGIHGTPRYVHESEYYFINGNNLVKGCVVINSDTKWVSREEYLIHKKDLDRNTIQLSINGTIGNIARYKDEPVMLGKSAAYIRFDNNLQFYYQLLQSTIVQNYFVSELSGSTIKNLSLESLKNTFLPVPPMAEQERIAEVLGEWDKAIELQAKLVERLQTRKSALMQQLLTPLRRLPNFTQPWQKVKLNNLCFTYNGLTGKNKEDFEVGDSNYIPYVNIFNNGRIDVSNLGVVKVNPHKSQNIVKYGDIFFTISSETPQEVGMSSVLLIELNNTYLNSFCFGYRLKKIDNIQPDFAVHYFRAYDFRKRMFVLAQGSTRFNISKFEVLNLKLAIPTIDEQKAIAEALTTADVEIDLAKRRRNPPHSKKSPYATTPNRQKAIKNIMI